jgi:putative N6-adenine-specific DNA methylase
MKFFASAAKGTEGVLRDELRSLRLPRVRADRGGVHFEGSLDDAMRACLGSRVAMRILVELATFTAHDADDLYAGVRIIPWHEHLTARHTLAVRATCANSALTHSHFIALKTKDAIVDALRDRSGVRPDVNADDPDVAVTVRLARDVATVYLDLSGEPLHRRGYRVEVTEATLKETLAAAVILLSGWKPDAPFIDPLCGSGTLAIEAAMMACNIAPGARRRFGFERWPAFTPEVEARWKALRDAARAQELPRAACLIAAYDREVDAVETTRRNAFRAGVEKTLDIRALDVRELEGAEGPGFVVSDPPYGDRLAAKPLQLAGFFRQFGEALQRMRGYDVSLLSGNPLMSRSLGMTAAREHTMFNGAIECRLLSYKIPR